MSCCLKFAAVTATEQIDAALKQGIEAVRNLVLNGFNQSITRFNLGQKYKFHKVWIQLGAEWIWPKYHQF